MAPFSYTIPRCCICTAEAQLDSPTPSEVLEQAAPERCVVVQEELLRCASLQEHSAKQVDHSSTGLRLQRSLEGEAAGTAVHESQVVSSSEVSYVDSQA